MDSGAAFLAQSREYLTAHYLPKIRAAVQELSEDDLWWRPNPASNAIGNLMLHLAGNIRQWVASGVGGAPDRRNRPAEFAAQEGISRDELLATLAGAVEEVDAVLARVDPATLDQYAGDPGPRVGHRAGGDLSRGGALRDAHRPDPLYRQASLLPGPGLLPDGPRDPSGGLAGAPDRRERLKPHLSPLTSHLSPLT